MGKKRIIIIGSGFSSLAASCYLAKAGYNVQLLEKNPQFGGRARRMVTNGFTFDMGPTFYWMPDVFENFFRDFGKETKDYYSLKKLNPAYKVYFKKGDSISISDSWEDIKNIFKKNEPGSEKALSKFMQKAASNYKIAMGDLVYKPGEYITEILTPATIFKIKDFFRSIKSQVGSYVKNPRLRKIMEFPVLFLGAKPSKTPSFYNFMNYADFKLGTWHPKGGMHEVVLALVDLAGRMGVELIPNSPVTGIHVKNQSVVGVEVADKIYGCDILLSGADYHHTETLLPSRLRQYTSGYWNKKTFAPSALLFFIGFSKKLKNLAHHTLFFDTDFEAHAKAIYDTKEWMNNPLFYCSFPSLTDDNYAPLGKECCTVLIPIAPGIEDTTEIRNTYFSKIIHRIEYITGQELLPYVEFKDSYCVKNFKEDYNSYKGNAYGLANTLLQTHVLRPRLRSRKVNNLFFCGQLTVPGPGVPPALISGKVVSDLIVKYHGI